MTDTAQVFDGKMCDVGQHHRLRLRSLSRLLAFGSTGARTMNWRCNPTAETDSRRPGTGINGDAGQRGGYTKNRFVQEMVGAFAKTGEKLMLLPAGKAMCEGRIASIKPLAVKARNPNLRPSPCCAVP